MSTHVRSSIYSDKQSYIFLYNIVSVTYALLQKSYSLFHVKDHTITRKNHTITEPVKNSLVQQHRHARIQRGAAIREPPHPVKNHKNIGFISNTGPDPLKITKLRSQH